MSETKTTRKQLPAYLILALIALAAALLLAVTNAITAGPIKAHEEAAQNAAFQSVMTADSFSTMSIPDGCNVTSLVEAKKDGKTIGYCAVSSAKGYGGNVAVTLGVDMDGKIVGCQIGDTNFAETDGFGARWKEPARAEAFIGLSAFGGDTIEAITGATVTSKAVLAASNDVLKCISHVLGKDVEGDVLAFGVKEEKPAQTVELTGDVHQGKAVGFGNGEVTARLTLNDDGTIAALVIDASTQTPGFGTRCADEEFTAQFIGKSGPFTLNENVDGLTGATITSTAAVEAINAALTSPAMAAEDLEPVATEAPAATEAPMVLENAKTATIAGFGGADITVQVTDENGVITALVVDASSQTAGLGQKCADEAFTSQFIGKSAPLTLGEGIDAVASATITSQAVVDAVNSLYAEAPAKVLTTKVKGWHEGVAVTVEIDKNLIPILEDTLSEYENVRVINHDVLKVDIAKLAEEENGGKPIKVVANLPYYITTPIIMGLFENHVPIKSITVMVQKEVADRMQVGPGTKDYGALSLAVQYYAKPYIVANVPPNCFMPRPKVGSAVIRLERYENPPVTVKDEKLMFRLIRASFNQRRKTLANGLKNSPELDYTKEEIEAAIEALGRGASIRGEALTLEEFAKLADLLSECRF